MSAREADREAQVLEYIRTYIGEHGCPPTRTEIAEHIDRTPTVAQRIVQRLIDDGLIQPHGRRGMRVVAKAQTEVM